MVGVGAFIEGNMFFKYTDTLKVKKRVREEDKKEENDV